jgi:hypothetical protein
VHNAADMLSAEDSAFVSSAVIFGDPNNGKPVGKVAAANTKVVCHTGDLICAGQSIILAHRLRSLWLATWLLVLVLVQVQRQRPLRRQQREQQRARRRKPRERSTSHPKRCCLTLSLVFFAALLLI